MKLRRDVRRGLCTVRVAYEGQGNSCWGINELRRPDSCRKIYVQNFYYDIGGVTGSC